VLTVAAAPGIDRLGTLHFTQPALLSIVNERLRGMKQEDE